MPTGITNITQIAIQNITSVTNLTTGDPIEFFINVNQIVFNGWLWFILLLTFWVVLYFAMQDVKDLGMINLMYSGALISIISFLMRVINVLHNGIVWGFLSDFQMWVFPLVTIILAVLVNAGKSAYS